MSCLPVVPVPLGEDEGEQEVEDDVPVVDGVPGDVGHEPVPELRQGSIPPVMEMMRNLLQN